MIKTLLKVACLSAIMTGQAAIPVSWTVETDRIQERAVEAFHGEELALEAVLNSRGRPLEIAGKTANLYWQTNGMDRLYWTTNAVVGTGADGATNVIRAVFASTMDPGASTVRGFLGIAGENYRANFLIRFRNSPGAVPNELQMPVATLDFAKVRTVNAPWIEETTADARYATRDEVEEKADKANVYTKQETESYVKGQIQSAGSITESGVRDIVTEMGSEFGKVQSVNGKTGTVSIAASDVGAYSTQEANEKFAPAYTGDPETEFAGEIVTIEYEYGKAGFGPYGLYTKGSENQELGIYEGAQIIHNEKPVVYGISTNGATLHGTVDLSPIAEDSRMALAYSRGVYQYMNGSTNAWFEGTNYNVNVDQAASKVKYQPEPWEDVTFTPCSLQLYEIRDGARRCVWDQRDWTVYYWNFKSAQMSNALANATHNLSENVRTNYMRRGWANYTAVNGLDNPNPSTLFVDTEKVSLMAGMQWEKMFEMGGHSYYTITSNGITISTNDAQSTFLSIKDFEGNACLTFRKTSSYLVWINTEIQSQYYDDQGRVCFTINTDVCPTAELSTVLEDSSFVEAGEDGCPADHEWTGRPGAWTSHFLLKPGISAKSCFARYKVMREGENIVEYSVPVRLNGGISFEQDGVTKKIRPRVSGNTVTWEVVQ